MFSKRKSVDWTSQRQSSPSFREKLSGFVRLGHGLARKPTLSLLRQSSRAERPSMDELPAAALPQVQMKDFGTSRLEIDLQSLEAFRDLTPQGKDQQQQQQQSASGGKPGSPKKPNGPVSKAATTTPIAEMFSSRRSAIFSTASTVVGVVPSLAKSSPALVVELPADKPGRVTVDERAPTATRASSIRSRAPADTIILVPADMGSCRSRAPSRAKHGASSSIVTVEIIDSSQGQTHTPRPWPPPEPETPASRAPSRSQPREPRRAAWAPSTAGPPAASTEPIVISGPMVRSRQNSLATAAGLQSRPGTADKRHSTPAALPPSLTISTAHGPQGALSVADSSVPPERRRRSWQPASVAGTPRSSGPPSASAPWQRLEAARRPSARLDSNRLAWLRDLEGGRKTPSGGVNSDLPVLKKVQGSVADKLARFESKGQPAQAQTQSGTPLAQMVPLSRSNSTRSRTSSVADTFISTSLTGGGAPTTARSSLDSHRASSVFSHYDESFREKMERLTANATQKVEDQGKPDTTKIASTFVAVDRGVMQ
ncbi:hypothetical protein RB594_004560 [Gaeumannomyces avenae]